MNDENMKNTTNTIKPDFKYIRIDETEYWNDDFVGKLGPDTKLTATYIFNANEKVYCCELTPSYYLKYVGMDIVPGRELSDEEWENANEYVLEGESQNDNDHYRWCRNVEKFEPKSVPCNGETLEEVIEEYSANPW